MSSFATNTDGGFRQAENPGETIRRLVKVRSRLLARLLAALRETRQREATRVINHYQHLVPRGGQAANWTVAKDGAHGSY